MVLHMNILNVSQNAKCLGRFFLCMMSRDFKQFGFCKFQECHDGCLLDPEFERSISCVGCCVHAIFFYFLFYFILFTQVQTPVTLCSGELWTILVVRLAHSADLKSRLRHVSSAPSVAYSTGCSRVVTHPGTNPARRCLTSVIWREPVCHRRLAVDKMNHFRRLNEVKELKIFFFA